MAKDETHLNIISAGTKLEGKIGSTGSLRVDGQVTGNVTIAGDLVIGTTGEIIGNIEADTATIGGKVNGNITVKNKIVFENKAVVRGDIKALKLVIDEGAIFDGKCEMSSNHKPEQKSELFR